jgi:hypothetical protein
LAISIVVILPLSLGASVYIIIKSHKAGTLTSEVNFKKKYGTLIEGVNLSTRIGRHWNLI